MVRKGMGKGTGKGYKNIMGVDKKIHSQSAKGIKQPQKVNPSIIKMADAQFKTISDKTKKELGINKTNFRKEFAEELNYIRNQRKYNFGIPNYEIRETSSLRINPDILESPNLEASSKEIIKKAIKEKKEIPIYYITDKVRVDNKDPKDYEFVYTTILVGVWSIDKNKGINFANEKFNEKRINLLSNIKSNNSNQNK